MTALVFLTLAAMLGAANLYLHNKYNGTPLRDRAAPWGVASGCALFAAIVAGAVFA